MTSQLVLVIVVVAAGIGVAGYLRAARHSRLGNRARQDGEDLAASCGEAKAAASTTADPESGFASTNALAEGDTCAGITSGGSAGPAGPAGSAGWAGAVGATGLAGAVGSVAPATPVAPQGQPSSPTGVASTGAPGTYATLGNGRAGDAPTMRAASATKASPPSSGASSTGVGASPTSVGAPPGVGAALPSAPQALHPTEIFAKLFDLALGKARPRSTVTAGHDEVAAATAAALQEVATQERYAPRRPNMLPRILSASNDDSFSRRELAALIARDPSLVGNLLKIANSSYYRVTTEPLESVDRAVVLLGTDGIRSLVTAALMQPIFRIGGADFPRFPEVAWEHTFRSASAAVPYNFLVEHSDPFAAELLSLVMGLAEIVVFRVTMDQYAKIRRLRPDAGVVSSLLDTHSANVARRIAASWELSEATIAGLEGQNMSTTKYPTALGRSLHFGRVVGALAVLRFNHVIDDETGKVSIPAATMPKAQLERMWTRLTLKPGKH